MRQASHRLTRNDHAGPPVRTVALLLAAILAVGLDTRPAAAVDLNRPAGIDALNRPGSGIDLQILESRQRRREFQQQQQNEREDDRQTVITSPRRLDVPRMQGSCQIRLNGSRYMTVCR